MKILLMGTEFFHSDGRTDRRKDRHDEANSHFCNLTNVPKNMKQQKFSKSTVEVVGTAYLWKAGTTYFPFLKYKIAPASENICQF
jgi:hypothetical protein